MHNHINNPELFEILEIEKKKKILRYIKWNESVVLNSAHCLQIDLGSCTSVVFCGLDSKNVLWFGINHLFKGRDENVDVALKHISTMISTLKGHGVENIKCLGLFGAGYKENSPAKRIAKLNVLSIIETLSLFDMDIEVFQTGFSQGLIIVKSDDRDSIIISNKNINSKDISIIEVPLNKLFCSPSAVQ